MYYILLYIIYIMVYVHCTMLHSVKFVFRSFEVYLDFKIKRPRVVLCTNSKVTLFILLFLVYLFIWIKN